MKIVIITSRYPNKNEPYNHMFVHMRCLEFVKRNHNVVVYIPSSDSYEYTFQGIVVKALPSKLIVKELYQYDIVYLHLLNIYPFEKSNGWPIYKYILNKNINFAMYVHGSGVQKFVWAHEYHGDFKSILKWIKKNVFVIPRIRHFVKNASKRKNANFIFPSKWIKEDAEKNLNLKIKNYHIIPNGIDVDLFKYKKVFNNRYKLLTLRPFSCKKYAVDIAIECMRFLPKEYTLDIFGKGKFEKQYKRLISKYNLVDRVSITNKFINRQDLDSFFSQYGVFLAPSRMDTQGLTVCEAMASGLLVATSDNTGIPEFVSKNITGILEKNPQKLANVILEVTTDKKLFEKITVSARDSMEKIAIEKMITKELEVLKKTII